MVVPGTIRLVIQFLEDFADTVAAAVTGQSDIVDEAEDRILEDRFLRDAGDPWERAPESIIRPLQRVLCISNRS